MDNAVPNPAPTAALARDGMLTRAQLAAEIGVSEQTIAGWEKEGLPVLRVGAQRFYETARIMAWIRRVGK